jgi:hypothetical protein
LPYSQKLHPIPFASAGTLASQDDEPNSVINAGMAHDFETFAAAAIASAAPPPAAAEYDIMGTLRISIVMLNAFGMVRREHDDLNAGVPSPCYLDWIIQFVVGQARAHTHAP